MDYLKIVKSFAI